MQLKTTFVDFLMTSLYVAWIELVLDEIRIK